MTGFGKSEVSTTFGRFSVEIQSLNRKYLESSVYLPKEFSQLEMEVKKWVSEKIARGSISVRVNFSPKDVLQEAIPDLELCRQAKESWEKIARGLGYEASQIDFNFLMQNIKGVLKTEDTYDLKKVKKAMQQAIQEALTELSQMRLSEGDALQKDLEKRLAALEKWVGQVEKKAPKAVASYQKKLQDRLGEYSREKVELDERLMKEILIYSEKVDISEEITRFFSHIKQFRSLIESKTQAVGRKMDFLIQEMVRETNTMGSKSNDIATTTLILDMKSEIDKLREQVQNIE